MDISFGVLITVGLMVLTVILLTSGRRYSARRAKAMFAVSDAFGQIPWLLELASELSGIDRDDTPAVAS